MIPERTLQQAAKLVVQERNMLLLSYRKLGRIGSAGKTVDDVEKNAYLESFMLHYRNILDFLEPRRSAQSDDVKATDFCPNHQASDPPTQYLKPIDKRLAHLSYGRLEIPTDEKPWPTSEMLQKIERTWKAFLDALDSFEQGRSDWFGPQTAQAAVGEPFIEVSGEGAVSASTSAAETSVFYIPPS